MSTFIYKGAVLEARDGEWGEYEAIQDYERKRAEEIENAVRRQRAEIDCDHIAKLVIEAVLPKLREYIKECVKAEMERHDS